MNILHSMNILHLMNFVNIYKEKCTPVFQTFSVSFSFVLMNSKGGGAMLPHVRPTSPPTKNAVSSSELLSMLKKVPSKDDTTVHAQQQPPPPPTTITATTSTPTPTSTASHHHNDDRGMLGLLQLIKSTGSVINLAAVGVDLEALGLVLDSPDPITKDWNSPWANGLASGDAQGAAMATSAQNTNHRIPACYILPSSVSLNPGTKLPHFSDETLLYIFYGVPRDRLQELAARELTARSWRYHKELQQWLTIEGELPLTAKCPSSTRTFSMYFDVTSWTRVRKDIVIDKEEVIEDRFLKR